MAIAIRGRRGGYPEMIEYFRKQGLKHSDAKGCLWNEYYFINKEGNLVSNSRPQGYILYESVEDIVKKSNKYELWD